MADDIERNNTPPPASIEERSAQTIFDKLKVAYTPERKPVRSFSCDAFGGRSK